jgi:hypothetical protein
MTLLHYDSKRRRLWIWRQRIHHGPVGCLLAAALVMWHPRWALACALWGLSDIHDLNVWFVLGEQFSE